MENTMTPTPGIPLSAENVPHIIVNLTRGWHGELTMRKWEGHGLSEGVHILYAQCDREGDKLPEGAISGTDDGQTVWLESSTGGAHRLGIWGGLSLRFTEADGSFVIRDYVATDALTTPASGSDGLKTVAWRWQWPGTSKWYFADYNLHAEAETSEPLVTREAAEKRIGGLEDRLTEELERTGELRSQVAALKAALPDLTSVIEWLANGCDPQHAVTELHIYQDRIDQAIALKEGR